MWLPVKSKAVDGYGGIAYISPTVAGETGYGAPPSIPLESSGPDSMITSLFQQQKDTMNQVHTAVNLQKDIINQVCPAVAPLGNTINGAHAAAMVADGLVDLGINGLLDGTGSSRSTAEKTACDSICSWKEVEGFLMNQLEGEEQEGIGPDVQLQVDDAWKQTNDVPAVQEPATGGALAYDPEFSIDDVQPWSPFSIDDVQPWSPQFAGDDYGMPF
jgi:hypothetical protein